MSRLSENCFSCQVLNFHKVAEPLTLECEYPTCLAGERGNTCIIANQHIGNEINLEFRWTATFDCIEFLHTNMSYFPNQVFQEFPSVYRLALNSNDLKVWRRSYLKGALNLEELYINNNPVTQFDDDAFDEAPNLRLLYINGTRIKMFFSFFQRSDGDNR